MSVPRAPQRYDAPALTGLRGPVSRKGRIWSLLAAVVVFILVPVAGFVFWLVADAPTGDSAEALPAPPSTLQLPPTTQALPDPVPRVRRIETTEPVVFVTIDDGHEPTADALALLGARRIPATLFLLAGPAEEHADYFRQIVAFGGSVENHSMSHKWLTQIPDYRAKRELCQQRRHIEKIYGRAPTMARPPFGDWDQTTNRQIAACGMTANVTWSAEVRNGRVRVRDESRLTGGDIVLLHTGEGLAADLEALFTAMDSAGVQAAPLQDYL